MQAHPFRNGLKIVDPKHLDGIETYNGNPRHDSRNEIAKAWAQKFGMLETSGSDFHEREDFARGGVIFHSQSTQGGSLFRLCGGRIA